MEGICRRAGRQLFVILGCLFLGAALAWGQPPAAPFPPQGIPGPGPSLSGEDLSAAQETLEDAWGAALSRDNRLEASRYNLGAAGQTLAAAQAQRYPSMTLGADYFALSDEIGAKLPAIPMLPSKLPFLEQQSGGVHALVTQPIYTFGRIRSGIDAAASGVAANQAEVARTQLDVKMSVAEAYVSVLRMGRLVEVAQNKVTSLESHNRDVAALFDKGMVAKTDFLAAQVSLANARQQLLQARNGRDVARAGYNRALGRPLIQPVNLAELTPPAQPDDVDLLTQQALQCRPEISQLSAQANALREQAASTQAKKAPQVAMAGGYLYQQDKYIDPNGIAGVGVGVEWNVIDFGRNSHEASSLMQKAEALIRTRMDLETQIMLDVRQKWLDLQTAIEQIEVARQTILQADENLRAARQRYQQQTGTNTEVLDAQTLWLQAYTNFYNSSYEAALARLRLARAVGTL